jgi:GTP-binding protein
MVADEAVESLSGLCGRHVLSARSGDEGKSRKRKGAGGEDLVVGVPVGTSITDRETDLVIAGLASHGDRACVAEGGRGGKGNARFATAVDRVPRRSERGQEGRRRLLRLDCRLAAHVAIVGPPSSGKSSLLARLTGVRPEIAEYAFTTRNANIGRIILPDFTNPMIVDMPALVDGSHEGKGLGNAFLRHAEESRLIIVTVDANSADARKDADMVRRELELYSEPLSKKPWVLVFTKIDLCAGNWKKALGSAFEAPVVGVSCETGEGIDGLIELLVSYRLCS